MRNVLVVGGVVIVACLAGGRAYGDCEGGPVFGQTVLAQNQNTLGWATPTDIEYVKGSLAGLRTYTSWVRGSLVQATGLDISRDAPPLGEGVFYLVKPTGPPCGSWQSSPGAEPARDTGIQPPCSQVAPTDEQIQAAIDAGLQVAPNPWSDEVDARRFFDYTQDALGCTFETFETTPTAGLLLEGQPQWNPSEFYCGLDFPNPYVGFALEWPAGPCLNLACFNHDSCYYSNCIGGVCAFSPQTVNTGCDTPLILDACGSSGCLQQDDLRWYFANKFICTAAVAFATAQQSNLFCQDPPCNDPGEVCIPPVCCGPPSAEICDNVDNDCDGTADSFPTSCGLGACAAVGTCTNGSDSCVPGVPSVEMCDGVDNDCDGSIDEGGDALCSDGNACTGVETCRGSAGCQAGMPLNCDDANPCTADACDPATGCIHTLGAGCGIVTAPGDPNPPVGFFENGTQRVEFDAAIPGGGLPPGLRLDAGVVISTASWGILTDYAQDSPVSDIFTLSIPHHLTISFDQVVLGGLPTAVGLVFTDAIGSGCNVTLQAWSGPNRSGTLLASVTAFRGNDGTNATNFADDSFFGIRGLGAIGSVDMTSDAGAGGLEADVLYYGSIQTTISKR